MRLFIAIDLPKKIEDEMWKSFAYSKDYLDFAFFTLPKNLHITLAFLGELNESIPPKIQDILKNITNKIGSHPIRINGCRIGPEETTPRMIWLEMDEDSKSLVKSLAQLVRSGLELSSIDYDRNYKFNPHITLARFSDKWQQSFIHKNEKQKNDELNKIKETLPESMSMSFEAESIILFQSIQENGERVYTPLFESNFAG